MTYPGVFNEVSWPGAGDPPGHADDCHPMSDFWALVAAGVLTKAQLPTLTAYRLAAGAPDLPGVTVGMDNVQALAAIKKLVPQARAFSYVGTIDGFKAWTKKGAMASLSVDSGLLPADHRFGFLGSHQVAVADYFYMMNPLAPSGSAPVFILETDLRRAAEGLHRDGKFHAIIVPPFVPPVAPPPAPVDPHLAEIASLTGQVAALTAQLAACNLKLVTSAAALTAALKSIATFNAKIAAARAANVAGSAAVAAALA